MTELNQFTPRICHVKKLEGYSGYGFSLRLDEQDGRQHICRVKTGSPAEEAGLLKGDILVEVNDVNVEEEAHASVLQRIIDSGNEVNLLVVEADKFYKDQGVKVTGAMPGVMHMASRTNISETNFYGPVGQQQMDPYHSGYDQGPTNEPRQLNPYHVGYDQPIYRQPVGGPNGPYPTIQQQRTPTVNQPKDTDLPCDITPIALLVCFCFCWCIGGLAVYHAMKAEEYFKQGNFEEGRSHRKSAIWFMVGAIALPTVFGIFYLLVLY